MERFLWRHCIKATSWSFAAEVARFEAPVKPLNPFGASHWPLESLRVPEAGVGFGLDGG